MKSTSIPTQVDFDALTQKPSKFSIHALKTSHVRPRHKTHVSSDLYTQIIEIPILQTETKSISALRWNQVIFDSPQWNQVNLNPLDKKTCQSIPIFKPCHFRPPNNNHDNFDHAHKNQCTLDSMTEINFDPHSNMLSISMPQHQTDIFSIQAIKSSTFDGFRPAYKDQLNFYHPHKNKVNQSPQ